MLRRLVPRPLALLLAVTALLVVAWAFVTTPFEGPDEPAHFSYIQYLAETGHRPSVLDGRRPESTQTQTALNLFNLDQLAGVADARPGWTKLEEDRFAEIVRVGGERIEKDGSGPNAIAKNPPLYYAYQVIPYELGSIGDPWLRLMLMRLASGLLIVLAVAFSWFAAAEIFAATWPRVIAAGCVALLPQLTAIGAVINADSLLIAVWTAFTFAALRLARRGANWRRVLAVCLLAGASLLTHGRGLAVVFPLAVVLLMALVRARGALPVRLARFVPGVVTLLAIVVVYRLALTPDTGGAYGGEINLGTGGALSLKGLVSTTWQFYFPRLPGMTPRPGGSYGYEQMYIESFFGRFASLEIGYPAVVYALIQLGAALGIAGLAAAITHRRAAVRERWPEVVTLVSIAVAMIGLLHLASYRALVFSSDPLITGRYLLPLVAIFGIAVAFAATSLRPSRGALLGTFVLTGLLALNLSGLMLTFIRFYA
jgi:4-amino-4-deoxy-L-arabinose transferase-like glycosyltransferase